jgi:hypothetical protein
MTWQTVVLFLALVCFLSAAVKVEPVRFSLVPLGLALWVITLLVH